MTRLQLRETTTTINEAVTGQSGARTGVQLITPGWGSSGYYSAEVLTGAATQRIFPAGTHMYLDHPTATKNAERPERSVRDLAAVLTSDASIDAGGALVAEADVLPDHREWVAAAKDSAGLSIRAGGMAEVGEAEGKRGQMITALTEGISVHLVTRAGRGGRVLALLESARVVAVERTG